MGRKKVARTPSSHDTPATPDTPASPESARKRGRAKEKPSSGGPAENLDEGERSDDDVARIDGDSVFRRSLGLTETALDDSLIVTDMLSNRSFTLNEVGVTVWRDLGARKPVRSVARGLCDRWGLEMDEALDVVRNYAAELLHVSLICRPDDGNTI